MRTVGAYEAKTHLPQLLDKVARGETLTITRHGLPVARLVPVGAVGEPSQLVAELRRMRRGVRRRDASIRQMIEEGRM